MLTVLLIFLSTVRSLAAPPEPVIIEGTTMGTTYRIVYFDVPAQRDFSRQVDSLLKQVNKAINFYDPRSEVSQFNRSKKGIRSESRWLFEILKVAKKVHEASGGAFDPTVMPLVNAWGFGPDQSLEPTDAHIDSLKQLVGFDRVKISRRRIRKTDPRIQLDFGGIGQGYGADVIFRYLRSQGIDDVLVELGGEGIAAGKNLQKNKAWVIGILDPESTPYHQFFKAYVTLNDRSYTTSGNYFNYKIIDGRKFGHTIDPATGRPVHHSLLSVSVFGDDCTTVDAWATAFMVMGLEKAMAKVSTLEGIEALFMYSDESGNVSVSMTPGLEPYTSLE